MMNDDEKKFLAMVHDKNIRSILLDRLELLGLLSGFLEAESGTNERDANLPQQHEPTDVH